jgi:hypothetical protein
LGTLIRRSSHAYEDLEGNLMLNTEAMILHFDTRGALYI